MPDNTNNATVQQNKTERDGTESKKDQQHKGSAFNEKPAGRPASTTFGEGTPTQNPEGENDILSGPDRKSSPQLDADV